jgi:hypothetical protein
MNIINILRGLASRNKQLNTKELPSMGLFYPDDLKIYIGKCTDEDIAIYEANFDPKNVLTMVYCMKAIVEKCVTMNKNYDISWLKSIDMLYLMLEIVKHTKGVEVSIKHYDDIKSTYIHLPINAKTFNYLDLTTLMDSYLPDSKEFLIDGYRLSIPSKGIETSLTEYLSNTITIETAETMTNYSYDFIYFLGNRNAISYSEIETLIEIFNDSMDVPNREVVSNVVKKFSPMISYTLKYNERVVEIKNKIDLATIWS